MGKIIIKICIAAVVWIGSNLPLTAQITADAYPADLAAEWFQLQLSIIPVTDGFTPPVTARALGYTGLTLYESVVNGSYRYKTLQGQLTDFTGLPQPDGKTYEWQLVANASLKEITSLLYFNVNKESKKRIENLYGYYDAKYSKGVDEATHRRSVKYGEAVAKAVYEYSKSDGAENAQLNNFPKDFRLPAGACMWVPVGVQAALQPYWGSNRTFIPGTADFHLPPPPGCEVGNSSLLYAQALEVYSVGKNLTDEQKAIARFWSDDPGSTFTPPGHGVSIATQLIKKEKLSLTKAAEVYCRVGIAASDAFISCWKCKYKFSILRPVSYINTAIDPLWSAYLSNPPFPEYTSGHATVSGAIAIVLSDMFGYNYAFTDNSHENKKYPARQFDNFWDYANEAAMSRLYGGIHYRNSNENGLLNGKRIGQAACKLAMTKAY